MTQSIQSVSPFDLVEGGAWGVFCGFSAAFVASSVSELIKTCSIEYPTHEKIEKIALAVKSVFVDLLSLGSSAAYLARWADNVELISLGRYLPLVKNLCFSLCAAMNTVEVVAGVYQLYMESKEILSETSLVKREIHKKKFCCALVRLVSNVSMVAWAALGLVALAGVVVCPVVSSVLLGVGSVAAIVSIFYKIHIDETLIMHTR